MLGGARQTEEHGCISLDVRHCRRKGRLIAGSAFTLRLLDGLLIVLGVRLRRIDFENVRPMSAADLARDDAGIPGAGEICHQDRGIGLGLLSCRQVGGQAKPARQRQYQRLASGQLVSIIHPLT